MVKDNYAKILTFYLKTELRIIWIIMSVKGIYVLHIFEKVKESCVIIRNLGGVAKPLLS